MDLWIKVGIGAILLIALLYWWARPIHWSDGEGVSEPDNPLNDSDAGSFRWWFFHNTDEGRTLGQGLNFRDWWENERRRWRR